MKIFYQYIFVFILVLINANCVFPQWTQAIGFSTENVRSITTSEPYAFAATYKGVYRSTNNGIYWSNSSNGLPDTLISTIGIAGNKVFTGTLFYGVYISTDSGLNWSPANNGLPFLAILSQAINGNNIFIGSDHGKIFLSSNNGQSWSNISNGLPDTDIYTIAINLNNIYLGTTMGVYRSSNNGSNWVQINNGIPSTYIFGIVIDDNKIFAATAVNGVYISTNNGLSWSSVNNGLYPIGAISSMAIGGHNIYIATSYGEVYFSSNAGQNWSNVSDGLPNSYIMSLAVNGNNILVGTPYSGIWWRPLSEFISSLVSIISPNGGENWQVGSNHNITWTSSNVANVKLEYSTDYGSNWLPISFSIPASTGSYSWVVPNFPSSQCKVRISDVSNLAVMDVSDNLFSIISASGTVLTLGYVNHSGDSVIVPLNVTNLINIGAMTLRIQYNPSILSFGRALNMARSEILVNSPLAGLVYIDFASITPININSDKLLDLKFASHVGNSSISFLTSQCEITDYAGNPIPVTYNNGNVITDVKDDNNGSVPNSYAVSQNFPNPFNPSTVIKYSIPFESKVYIKFFNSLGQIVHEVDEATTQAGYYELNFNSSRLTSGIYFYSIKAVSMDGKNNFSVVKKMIIMK